MEEHSSYLLPPGGVAFVVTKEEICLPSDFAGIMTAKSGGVAERGILITNTGQVDPGFRGPLRYAVMNMGAEGFALERGHSITKLMLFKLSSPASPNWNEKVGHSSPATPSRANLASLGEELLNIQRRAEKTARKAVQIELSNWGLRSVALGFIAAVVIAVIERI
jgi:dUTPase